jgi:hypothetical protein
MARVVAREKRPAQGARVVRERARRIMMRDEAEREKTETCIKI